MNRPRWLALLVAFLGMAGWASSAGAQGARVSDLTLVEGEVPVRLVGYGLVVGLSNTGDRVFGGRRGGMTVRSVANLLRNLGVDVPEEFIRTRNAAAVLVTAEASPYTRRGGRFDVTVASVGDATSLRGGMLWTTPLFASIGGTPMASAQGNIALPGSGGPRSSGPVETSAVLTGGGVALADVGSGMVAGAPTRLLLRRPDLGTAVRIVDAVNASLGDGVATLEDPGSVRLELPEEGLAAVAAIGDIEVLPTTPARVVIDARTGAVAAGGSIAVGPAVVSHDWLTLTILDGALEEDPVVPGAVLAASGVQVQELAQALHAVGASAELIASVFQSLRSVGALQAEVLVQ